MSRTKSTALLIAVIAVLAGSLLIAIERAAVHYFSRHRESQLHERCKGLLSNLEQSIRMYQLSDGSYPPSGHPGLLLSRGPMIDPWGREFVYLNAYVPGKVRRTSHGYRLSGAIELYSMGPNGIDECGAGDDVRVGD